MDAETIIVTEQTYINLLRSEVVPALGCTEPIAVALAVARAREALPGKCVRVSVATSANIYKNGMGVGIPGTGQTGLTIAAALGAIEGRSADSLELLKHVNAEVVARARLLVAEGAIDIHIQEGSPKLYVRATLHDKEGNVATCTIQDKHSSIAEVTLNGKSLLAGGDGTVDDSECHAAPSDGSAARAITVTGIFDFADKVPIEKIAFILESEKLNRKIAQEGLSGNYGLEVGRKIKERMEAGTLGKGLMTEAMAMTAAASDARMAGSTTPVMSNSGSGNQGITATLPVVAAADYLHSSTEKLTRALALSHLVAIHIKGYLGRLSALCGCVVASSGAGCGIAYLMGGGEKEVEATIKNMLGSVTGMLCDGAKVGCALKVSSGVSTAVTSALLAMEGSCISANDGIIETDIERCIRNLGNIGAEGMRETDEMVLEIMTHKAE